LYSVIPSSASSAVHPECELHSLRAATVLTLLAISTTGTSLNTALALDTRLEDLALDTRLDEDRLSIGGGGGG